MVLVKKDFWVQDSNIRFFKSFKEQFLGFFSETVYHGSVKIVPLVFLNSVKVL